MNRNSIIIIAIIAIIAIALGMFVFMQPHTSNGKIHTEIDFLSESTLKNGEAVEFVLRDEQNHVLANQSINIIFNENGENQTYSIFTDVDGKGSLVLNNEAPGDYDVYVTYNGTNRYDPCSAKVTVTVEEGTAEASSSDVVYNETTPGNSSAGTALYNGNSSSGSPLHYDAQYNFYYDDNGIIRGGQNDGYSAEYIRDIYSSGDMIDEDGNLQ